MAEDQAIKHFQELVSSDLATVDPTSIQIRANALVARLKALNRNANAATRACKQATTDARHDMDQTYLGLQNLLYEKRHLEREIDKCRQFASIYQDVPLYSLPEFKTLAPPEARSDDVLHNTHQLMLNRLSFELVERQRLDQKRKELTAQKEDLLKHSKLKLATVESVKTQIESLMKAAADIQKKVDELVPALPPSTATTPAPT
ncbi:Fms-interacting protein-domain-containing protein [Suillus clintonianus]|uniref:Fms-interacting protein-domain-containing protein n=1 Tax=Suillus clintonianus TaxID=1904413 RepID=UPI001B85D064|nr:Fms-interacting protein-domain-containing protein [Suillus clintonianus]KAG2156077.1 Fms-interacting protein-domain-containing protein [Suillus clintonianus]